MECRLRELREKKGLNQTGMAMILHVSQQTVSRIESGSLIIPIDLAIKSAEYFEVSVDYFLGLTEERSHTTSASRIIHIAKKYEGFLEEYWKLNPKNQKVVDHMIHELLEIQEKS